MLPDRSPPPPRRRMSESLESVVDPSPNSIVGIRLCADQPKSETTRGRRRHRKEIPKGEPQQIQVDHETGRVFPPLPVHASMAHPAIYGFFGTLWRGRRSAGRTGPAPSRSSLAAPSRPRVVGMYDDRAEASGTTKRCSACPPATSAGTGIQDVGDAQPVRAGRISHFRAPGTSSRARSHPRWLGRPRRNWVLDEGHRAPQDRRPLVSPPRRRSGSTDIADGEGRPATGCGRR